MVKRNSRSPPRRRDSRSGSTKRQKLKVAEDEHCQQSSRWDEHDLDSRITKTGGIAHSNQRSRKRKYEEENVGTSVEEVKPRKRIGLISQDCPGFQDPHARCIIDQQELTRILIDIRREVERPRSRAKVERELGDPSLFVVPRDQRQPLATRIEFKGARRPWQEVNVVVSPLEGWEERLMGSNKKAGLESEMLMSRRPEFRGAEKGWQQVVVIAKPIEEWEEKLEETLRRKVDVVVVVKPIKKWDDKLFPTVSEERGLRWRKGSEKSFKNGGPEVERTRDKKRRRKRRG